MAPYAHDKPTPYLTGSSQAVVIVDPYSTGCCVAQEISRRGYNLVAVWSDSITDEMKSHVPSSCADLFYYAEVRERSTAMETAEAVRSSVPFDIAACICGGETGVTLNDALGEALGVRTNGTDIPHRRDKKLQQELVRARGLRAVRQAGGKDFCQVEPFLRKETYPVVVKPVESAGSDGVKLCHTFDEAREHFNLLLSAQQKVGSSDSEVLCQEFLRGKEYVVDHVSRDGVHKTTMVWVYDKRPANGAAFVYFGCIPISPESEEGRVLIPYVRGVLDAMDVRNGASHGEVMMTPDGPCLVEMNCRAHGGDGNWIPMIKAMNGGYTQVDAAVDAFLDPSSFDRLPDRPPSPFKAAGQEVILVSFSKGVVKSAPGFEVIRKLPSFVYLETRVDVGTEVDYTVDLFTDVGSVILMHRDPQVVERDIQFIRYVEEINGLFSYETKLENLKRPRADEMFLPTVEERQNEQVVGVPLRKAYSLGSARLIRHFSNDRPELRAPLVKRMTTIDASKEMVVLVDPYSTGAVIAKEVMNRTYNAVALWSRNIDEGMRKHVPTSATGLRYLAEVEEGATLEETADSLKRLAEGKCLRIVACFAGAEFGVPLADSLSEKLGVRTNGTAILRRDKKIQQELVRDAGLRAVRQAAGSEFSQVESFLRKESYPVVVKPVESAGSDGVKLCHTFEEAREHFHLLMNAQNQCGGVNASVLCQEFLRGKEYVVDHVSRDGVHKTAMVWVYDKRPANGSAFVYFGCIPVDSDSPEAKLIVPYVRGVLDALGVKNGPSHGEVMMTPGGPCLVEMNVRAHGGDANWMPLCRGLNGGYSQVDAAVDSYLDKRAFFALPDRPPSPFRATGQEVILVSYSRGTVKSTPGFDEIRRLESFVYLETGIERGSRVEHTTDLFTCLGSAILMHPDEEVVRRDILRIRNMEKNNELFVYEDAVDYFRSPSMLNLRRLSDLVISSNDDGDGDGDGAGGDGTNRPSSQKKQTAPAIGGGTHRRIISSDRMDIFW